MCRFLFFFWGENLKKPQFTYERVAFFFFARVCIKMDGGDYVSTGGTLICIIVFSVVVVSVASAREQRKYRCDLSLL